MNKAKLVEQMAKISGLPKATCKDCLEAFFSAVGGALKQGQDIVLTRFGTFTVMKRKSRVGVNPSTGKKMQIPAKRVAKFRPSKWIQSVVK